MYNNPYSHCMQSDSEQRYLTPTQPPSLVAPKPLTPNTLGTHPLPHPPSHHIHLQPTPPRARPRPDPRHQHLPRPLLRLHLPLLLHNLLLLHHAHRERHAQHHRARRQHPEALAAPPGARLRRRERGAERGGEGASVAGGQDVAQGEEAGGC